MRAVYICLSVCFLNNIANIFIAGSDFNYHQYRRDGETCRVCNREECWSIEQARCEYYLLANQGTVVEEGGTISEVDRLMSELVEEVMLTEVDRDCIPFITFYTNCHKENACLGCKSCTCDNEGRWSCVTELPCHHDREVVPDHHVLTTVIETLSYNKNLQNKKKRSIPTKETLSTNDPTKVLYSQLAELMYGVKPSLHINFPGKPRKFGRTAIKENTSENPFKQNQNQIQNIDYIDLDDVLNTIGLPLNNKRRKAKLEEKSYDSHDFTDIYEMKDPTTTDDFLDNMFNALESGGDNNTESSTKVVIVDLLRPSNKNGSFNYFNPGYEVLYDMDEGTNNSSFQRFSNTAKNIMKRQVPSTIASNGTNTVTLNQDANTTNLNVNNSNINVNSLTDDVLNPINNIIADKEKEITYLFKVKQNLQTFINSYNNTEISLSMKNNTAANNDSFSIYKLDIYPELQYNLRKINPNSIDKLLYKLKRDIFEVVRDVSAIQKMSKTRDLPNDLRALIEAMKLYIRNKSPVNKIADKKTDMENDIRRHGNSYTTPSISARLIDILKETEIITPNRNGLTSLTPSSRKIIKRVIKNYYYDASLNNGLQIHDPEYNLTNNLREIGVNWNRYIEIFDNCDTTEMIYAMKLLHYGLSNDIVKITDALTLVTFAYSRRMVPVEGVVGEQLTDVIINGLKTMNDKVQFYAHFNKKQEKYEKHEIQKTKKQSFLKKIKNLLRGAKQDLGVLFQNKLSKSEMINKIAQQRLDETNENQINEFENTMRKWQNNLQISRMKRSVARMEKVRNRLTNILPKYLRGKLNPAINANKEKAKAKRVNSRKNEGAKILNKTKQVKVTTSKHKTKHTTRLPQRTNKRVTSKPTLGSKTTKRPKISKTLSNLTKGLNKS